MIGTQPVEVTSQPESNYIRYYYSSSKNVLEITFNNINYVRTSSAGALITLSVNTTSSVNYSGKYDILLTLEGTNTIGCARGSELEI